MANKDPLSPIRLSLNRVLHVLVLAFTGWFLWLCLVNYFFQRPLWLDEQCLFESIKKFSTAEIFGRELLKVQICPRAYLFLVQKLSRAFDYHLLSLRFLPLMSMLAAFLIWVKLSSFWFARKLDHLMFVAGWSASALLLYYSGELKPYSMDVLAASLFLLFLYKQEDLQKKEQGNAYIALLVALPALGMLSYPAFLFTLLPLYNIVVLPASRREKLLRGLTYGGALILFVSLSYYFDIRWRSMATATRGFDEYFVSFKSAGAFFETWWEGTINLFGRWFAERPRVIRKIAIVFVSFGLIRLFVGFFLNIKKDRFVLRSPDTVALPIYLFLFLLGALHKYPFTVPRTSLFFAPFVLYLTVKGIRDTARVHPFICYLLYGAYAVFLGMMVFLLARIVMAGELVFAPKVF